MVIQLTAKTMEKYYIACLLYIDTIGRNTTNEKIKKLFPYKRYNKDVFSSLLANEYIAINPVETKYCYLTNKGENLIRVYANIFTLQPFTFIGI